MSYKPILFNTEMVKAILEGRKTQTRRIIKLAPGFTGRQVGESGNPDNPLGFMYPCGIKRPPCNKDDILWVRETFLRCFMTKFLYKADDSEGAIEREFIQKGWAWHPSIHMPKEAARIFLRVRDVRVERLQDMDEEAAIAEGFADSPAGTDSPLERFSALWDKTVKRDDLREYGYHANPWVWVIEFERIEKPEGWCL